MTELANEDTDAKLSQPDTFEKLLSVGDKQALKSLLSGTTESERSKLAVVALRWYKKSTRVEYKEVAPGRYGSEFPFGQSVAETSALAVMATADADQLSKPDWHVIPREDEDLEWIATLKPSSLQQFSDTLLTKGIHHFTLVSKLMNLKVCCKPKTDLYITGILWASRQYVRRFAKDLTLQQWLLSIPDFLEEDIWRIFEIDGDQENNLAALDKYSVEQPWSKTMVVLAHDGSLSKQRLLEASLDALNRGFNQFRSGWFSRFHEELKPSIAERQILIDRYSQLLGSMTPPTVALALKALLLIDTSNPLPQDILLKHLAPALASTTKSTASGALRLLERELKRSKEFGPAGCLMAVEALQHESPEIQAKVIDMLDEWGDRNDHTLQMKISNYFDSAAPSVRPRMQNWTNQSLPPDQPQAVAQYSYVHLSSPGWPFSNTNKLASLQSFEQILSTAGYCLEHPHEVCQIEQVIDAIARLEIARDETFHKLSAPLNQRVNKLLPWSEFSRPSSDHYALGLLFADFLRRWLSLSNTPKPITGHPALTFMAERMWGVLERLRKGIFLPTLSAPSIQAGWIDPNSFSEREMLWLNSTSTPDEYDLLLTLLRTPISGWDALVDSALMKDKRLTGSLSLLIGENSATADQITSFSLLSSYLKNQMSEGTGPGSVKGTIFCETFDIDLARWIDIACPTMREAFFAAGVRMAAPAIEYWTTDYRPIKAYLEALTRNGAPLEKKALTLLSIGLIISDPECCGLARDAVILSIDEQRLQVANFAVVISSYLNSDRSRPKRLSKSLSEIARVSGTHADAVIQIIELSLRGDQTHPAKDLSCVLELLHELLVSQQRKLEDEDAKTYLLSIARGGKTAQLIKKLI